MTVLQLPVQPTSFVGRQYELQEIARLLAEPTCRLLTLVGAGGIGKTRLALRAAEALLSFRDGVYFVPLQPLTSSDLLPSAIASALKISFYGADEPHVQIINYLHEKQMLLVMDNFEHLLDGVDLLTALLEAEPGIKLLVTSRERLNVREEWTLMVEGLMFPEGESDEALERYEAVQLFVQRARQVQSGFSLKENADAVKVICQQVEGMPLGIELAVSELRVMSCTQIAEQMARSVDVLATPLRNVPERHRSIRAAFEQSWKLLSDDEQRVLMKLSVFRGGFDLEAAGEVADAMLPTLASLADKSLIRVQPSGRYDLHELLRQFATDKLAEAGETINTANQHLDYFMRLAEMGEVHAYGSEQLVWYDRQEAEMDNLRAALAWSLSSENIEAGLRTAAALRWVWEVRRYASEAVAWYKRLLTLNSESAPSVRSKALHRACETAGSMLGYALQASEWGREALRLARESNDDWNIAWALSSIAHFTAHYPDFDGAAAMLEESLALFRKLEDPLGLSQALRRRGIVAIQQSDHLYAQSLLEEALSRDRAAADKQATAWELNIMATIVWRLYHDPRQAIPLCEESIALFREVQDMNGVAHPLVKLADIEFSQGNYTRARALYLETPVLSENKRLEGTEAAALAVLGMGNLAAAEGKFERATKLLAAVNAAPILTHLSSYPALDHLKADITAMRTQLDQEAFEKAWAEGKAMSIEQAVAYALGEESAPIETTTTPSAQGLIEPLSERELDVLRLMAEGLSNPQIAEKLVVATGTIKAHTNSIFGKLGVGNRVQAVNRAKELKLL